MKENKGKRSRTETGTPPDWAALAPPGLALAKLTTPALLLLAGLNLYGLCVLASNWNRMLRNLAEARLLSGESVRIEDFSQMGGAGVLLAFRRGALFLLLYSLALCLAHYYRGGSRPLNLLRRLPDPLELPRRTLALPLLLALGILLAGLLLVFLAFLFYLAAAPGRRLPPEVWGQLAGVLSSLFRRI